MRRRRMMSAGGIGIGVGIGEGAAKLALTPSQIPGIISWWEQSRAVTASGDVASLPSWPINNTTPAPTLSTETVARRPALTAGRIVFDAVNTERLPTRGMLDASVSITLPDGASGSTPTKGFTNTGIAKAGDGTWRFGNYGKPLESTAPATNFATSVVKTSADMLTYTSEVTGASLGATQNLTLAGFQGIAFDTDGTMWGAMPESGLVYHWTDGGAIIGTAQVFTGANGLAFDLANDQVVVCAAGTNPTVVWKDKNTWVTIKQRVLPDASIDHLFVTPDGLTLFGSGGINTSAGRLVKMNIATSAYVNYTLVKVAAVEGIHVSGTTVTVNTDQYYHNVGATLLNRVLTFDLGPEPLAYTAWGNRIICGGIFKATAVPGTTSCAMSIGEPLSLDHEGLGIFFGSTGDLRVISGLITASITDAITVEHLRIYDINLATLTVDCRIDGVAQPQKSLAGSLIASIGALPVVMGSCMEAATYTRPAAMSMASFMFGGVASAAYIQEIEGRLAWDAGLASTYLPVSHPYRNSPP